MREEVLTISDKEISIEVVGSKINSVRNKNIIKKGARVFKSNKIFSSSYVGLIDNSDLLERAVQNEDGAINFDYELPDISSEHLTDNLKSQSGSDLFAKFKEAVAWLNKQYPNFIFSGRANLNKIGKELEINEGSRIKHDFDICGWSLIYKHRGSAGIVDGYFGATSVYDFDIEAAIQSYSRVFRCF